MARSGVPLGIALTLTASVVTLTPVGCSTHQHSVGILPAAEWIIMLAPDSGGQAADVERPDLRDELLAMSEMDQVARKRGMRSRGVVSDAAGTSVGDVDKRNLARMKDLVDTYGWPTRTMVGYDGNHAAWLLVQHGDRDVVFQRRCLDLMKKLVDQGEVSSGDVAYLTDRVLVNEGKLQIYATQGSMVDGRWQPRSMIDPDNVDKRRTEVGLSTLKEYRELMHT